MAMAMPCSLPYPWVVAGQGMLKKRADSWIAHEVRGCKKLLCRVAVTRQGNQGRLCQGTRQRGSEAPLFVIRPVKVSCATRTSVRDHLVYEAMVLKPWVTCRHFLLSACVWKEFTFCGHGFWTQNEALKTKIMEGKADDLIQTLDLCPKLSIRPTSPSHTHFARQWVTPVAMPRKANMHEDDFSLS